MSQLNNNAEHDALNPPTIAFLRDRNGCPGLRVFCNNHHCLHRADFLWKNLGKPDTTPPVMIRFKCSKCGGRDVDIMPDWPKVPGAAHPWC